MLPLLIALCPLQSCYVCSAQVPYGYRLSKMWSASYLTVSSLVQVWALLNVFHPLRGESTTIFPNFLHLQIVIHRIQCFGRICPNFCSDTSLISIRQCGGALCPPLLPHSNNKVVNATQIIIFYHGPCCHDNKIDVSTLNSLNLGSK